MLIVYLIFALVQGIFLILLLMLLLVLLLFFIVLIKLLLILVTIFGMSVMLLRLVLICFFFSSRRRHTRCLSDWSSDVCSSDLSPAAWSGASTMTRNGRRRISSPPVESSRAPRRSAAATPISTWAPARRPPSRSEERRVGKECRSRWSSYH